MPEIQRSSSMPMQVTTTPETQKIERSNSVPVEIKPIINKETKPKQENILESGVIQTISDESEKLLAQTKKPKQENVDNSKSQALMSSIIESESNESEIQEIQPPQPKEVEMEEMPRSFSSISSSSEAERAIQPEIVLAPAPKISAETSIKNILDSSRLNANTPDSTAHYIFGGGERSNIATDHAKKEFNSENISFLRELNTVVSKNPSLENLTILANKFVVDNAIEQINLPSDIKDKILDGLKTGNKETLLEGLSQANKNIFKLFDSDAMPRIRKITSDTISDMTKGLAGLNLKQQLEEVNKLIKNSPSDVISHELKIKKQNLLEKNVPILDTSSAQSIKDTFDKFKAITTTSSSFNKPDFLRGDIANVYKSFEKLQETMEKNPNNKLANDKALLDLDKQLKSFIAKNPNSSKIEIIKEFSRKVSPMVPEYVKPEVLLETDKKAKTLIKEQLSLPTKKDNLSESEKVRAVLFGKEGAAFDFFASKVEFSPENTSFLKDLKTSLQKSPPSLDDMSKLIDTYIKDGAELQINIPATQKDEILKAMNNKDFPALIEGLSTASFEINQLLGKDTLHRFENTKNKPDFQEKFKKSQIKN